jgi:hypothetical protein
VGAYKLGNDDAPLHVPPLPTLNTHTVVSVTFGPAPNGLFKGQKQQLAVSQKIWNFYFKASE